MIRFAVAALSGLLLAGCFSQAPAPTVERSSAVAQNRQPATVAAPIVVPPGHYQVKRGDTLYRIALDNGADYRDIAAWNNLQNPSAIREGQILRVAPEAGDGASGKPLQVSPVVESRPLAQEAGAGAVTSLKKEPRGGKEAYSDQAYARVAGAGAAVTVAEAKPEAKPESKPETKPEPAPTPVAVSGDDVAWAWPTPLKPTNGFSDSGNKGMDFPGKAGDPVLVAGDGKVVYAGNGLRGYGELIIVKHNATYLSAYAHNRKILVKEGQMVSRGQRIAEMGNTDSENVKLHFEIRKQGKPVDPALYLPKR